MVYKSVQRKSTTKLAQAFAGRIKFVLLVLKPVGCSGFAPELGVPGPGEFVFVVLVRIVSPDEFAFFPVGVLGSGEFGVFVGIMGSGGVVVVTIMGAGASGVLVGTEGCGGVVGSITTVGSDKPAGFLTIVFCDGRGAVVPGSVDCITGGGMDGSAGVEGSGGGARSTRLRSSLGCPNQNSSTK